MSFAARWSERERGRQQRTLRRSQTREPAHNTTRDAVAALAGFRLLLLMSHAMVEVLVRKGAVGVVRIAVGVVHDVPLTFPPSAAAQLRVWGVASSDGAV